MKNMVAKVQLFFHISLFLCYFFVGALNLTPKARSKLAEHKI